MVEDLVPVLLEGGAKTAQIADKIANAYRNCPYVAFMATIAKRVFIIHFLPGKHRWWIEYVEKKPQTTLGLDKAKLTFPDKVVCPRKMKIRFPRKKAEITPCSSDYAVNCSKCFGYNSECLGCLATIYCKGKQVRC